MEINRLLVLIGYLSNVNLDVTKLRIVNRCLIGVNKSVVSHLRR